MKRYFRNVKRPRWYVLIMAAILYTWQCMAIIPMFIVFGGGYYLVVPIQFVAGLLLIMMYLMVQKDHKRRAFLIYIVISLICATLTTRLIFAHPFNSVPGLEGVLYGIAVCFTFATAYYFVINIIRQLFHKKEKEINISYNTGIKLVAPDTSHEKQYQEMMEEWTSFGRRLNPGALKNKGNDYKTWLSWAEQDFINDLLEDNKVPQTLYFCVRKNDNKILGAISIRHYLNDDLLETGGHIGYGIRPSQRRKGYATKMLALALKKCVELGINKALITCDKSNVVSANVIKNNGGILENEVINEEDVLEQRYWIDLF